MDYSTRFVHKVAPSDKDVGRPDRSEAARRILIKGGTVQEYRVERDGRIVVFPTCPGLSTYWHSIILSPIGRAS